MAGLELEDAFAPLRFDQPVAIETPAGETNRLFVLERRGSISVITNLAEPTKTLFLDIRASTSGGYEEGGLLGLAFHPGFATNGHFFIYRTTANVRNRNELSRFTVSAENPNSADPASEVVLISQFDRSHHHNGGGLQFGPDGYLYLAIGEDGPWADNASDFPINIDKAFFGVMLRIDVDSRPGNLPPNTGNLLTANYAVPTDNPWVGAQSFMGRPVDTAKLRTEIYAVGLRQPYRFSFDSKTGELLLGDVGAATWEEVNAIRKGGNYGWPYREGPDAFQGEPGDVEFDRPLHFIPHGSNSTNVGGAIVGGVVSRGGPIAELEGYYVFGDFLSGNIWKLNRDAQEPVRWIAREMALSCFGFDPRDRSILLANVADGRLRRIVKRDPDQASIPQRLSEVGVFEDLRTLQPAPGIVPFEINVPFWSDHAVKKRWFSLPDTNQVFGFLEDRNWQFPAGSFWIKHFEMELRRGDPTSARRLETRLLVKGDIGIFGYTYRWNNEGTEASLVPPIGMDEEISIQIDGETRSQMWHFPGRGECRACHTGAGGYALGFGTAQLNRTGHHGENQLEWLARNGYLDRTNVQPRELRRLARGDDESAPIEYRVRSFLAANCAGCHQPEGLALRMRWDARIFTPTDDISLVNGVPLIAASSPDDRLVLPGSITNSLLFRRLDMFDSFFVHMPPLATSETNTAAVELLKEWTLGMPTNQMTDFQIGQPPLEGSAHLKGSSQFIGGAGALPSQYYFRAQPMTGNSHIVVKLKSVPGLTPGLRAGLAFLSGAQDIDSGAWFVRGRDQKTRLMLREPEEEARDMAVGSAGQASWLRLMRAGQRVVALESSDGNQWNVVGESELTLASTYYGGLAIGSGEPWTYGVVETEQFQSLETSLSVIDSTPGSPLPKTITMQATVKTNESEVRRIDFIADGQKIGEAQAPWRFDWTNAWAGSYSVTSIAFDQNGLAVTSAPVNLALKREASQARTFQSAPNADGNWSTQFGRSGYAIPGARTNWTGRTQFEINAAEAASYAEQIGPGLDNLEGAFVRTAWTAERELVLRLEPPSEYPYCLTLYFANYGGFADQSVTLKDPVSGLALDNWQIQPGPGLFETWMVRGPIEIIVTSLNGLPARLSGIFMDPLVPPQATLSAPSLVLLPGSARLQATATAAGRPIKVVQFWDGAQLLNEDFEAPYEFTWTNIVEGEHALFARAFGHFGLGGDSTVVAMRAQLPPAAATVVARNSTLLGDWPDAFGDGGFAIPGLMTNLPTTFRFGVNGLLHIWTPNTTNTVGLRRLFETNRFSSVMWDPLGKSLNIDAVSLDGRARDLALYFMDDPSINREQRLRAIDTDTGAVLFEEPLRNIADGLYVVVRTQGKVQFKVEPTQGWEPVLGAIFLGGPLRPFSKWRYQHWRDSYFPEEFWADDPDSDGRFNLMEYALGSQPLESDPPPMSVSRQAGKIVIELETSSPPLDIELKLMGSADLKSWERMPVDPIESAGHLNFEAPIDSSGERFFRIEISLK